MTGVVHATAIRLGDVEIILPLGCAWRPPSPSLPVRPRALREHLAVLSRLQPPLLPRDRMGALEGAAVRGDPDDFGRAAFRLLGLGPGLTPAGDDVICGLLAGLAVLEQRSRSTGTGSIARALAFAVSSRVDGRTTALSRTLLHFAARGIVVAPLLDTLCTLGSDGPLAGLDRVMAIGHSSGKDMLAGVRSAAAVILQREEAGGAALDPSA